MRILATGLAGVALLLGLAPAQPKSNTEATMIHVKRITPVLYVEEIEPCLKFWTERVGFTNAAQVPDGNKIGFLMLQKDGTEIMYQTFASQEKDVPAISQIARKGPAFLFIEVEKLDPIIAAGIDQLILELKRAFHMTIIVVTHELASAFLIADRMLLIDKGNIVALGTADEMRRSSQPRVRQFLDRVAEPEISGELDYLQMLTAERPQPQSSTGKRGK